MSHLSHDGVHGLIAVFYASLIPVAIIGAVSFYATFVDVLSQWCSLHHLSSCAHFGRQTGIIGYWSTVWAVIVLVEHFVFRRSTWARYNMEDWDRAHRLPWGVAAVLAFACAFGIIIPSMSQVWYTGPIALAGTGDIGILAGSGVALVTFLAFRAIEKAVSGR